ncbi:chemotaxis protein [Pseudomonas flexibilis]|uniref:Chemotaxis protein n=3 Tax=Pseudomonas flexibilis TaxID=706570 RepID=A0A0B3BPW6_9PSED|nr:methyl-accepting chemotaxis protein [Pseudomonas flexibilis]KHO66548.1 chemotaxis protein [Pseudomonas flexibilis]SCY33224.1 methyl-accepting chemotaxis protein [Pseudomonas flexibilis]
MNGIGSVLANMGVGRKLRIGFGLIMLLTLAVAGTGYYALNAVQERASQMQAIAAIERAVVEAYAAEIDYESNRKDQALRKVRDSLASAATQSEALAGKLEGEARQRILAIGDDARAFVVQFDAVVENFKAAVLQRQRMEEAANEARDEFSQIELEMYDAVRELRLQGDRLRGSDPLTLAETASGLNQRMMDLRLAELRYIHFFREEFLQNWQDLYAEQQRISNNLIHWLDDERKEGLRTGLRSLELYRQAFEEFRQARDTRLASSEEMGRIAAQAVARAQQAAASAAQAMDAQITRVALLLAGFTLAALVLAAVAGVLITRSILQPLRQTVEIARRVAEGDLRYESSVSRRDELGQLQSSMASMTASLRTLVGHIEDGVQQIASSSEELAAVTTQTSTGMQSQRQETEQAATAMHQMALTVQEVARNAEQASQAAHEADSEARQGNQVVQRAVGQIGDMAREVEETATVIQSLQAESGRIGSVLEVIRAVAEQTNLLALNAAIEAARAGEQGRGFAVVADEVRALALRTHDSTEEIETLIASLQEMSDKAVTRMESSRRLTQDTVELAGAAGGALQRIAQAVANIEQMNQQIAASAEEQSAAAETISQNMVRVRDIGVQTAAAGEQTAASSNELARLGVELRELVAQFKR